MSDETPAPTPAPAPEPTNPADMRVVVRAYPKVIFFWPTWVLSLVAALLMPGDGVDAPVHLGTVWMCVFAFNLIVIAFDFSEVISVMVMAIIGVLIFAGLYFNFLGPIGDFFAELKLFMSKKYYWTMFGLLSIIYAFVFLKARFDYWEFRYNEVIHRRGVFADIKRYSTEDLRWFKEIPDVMERILAGSGRMILTTPREPHPIVIEHVLRIGSVDEKVADILGVKRVTLG